MHQVKNTKIYVHKITLTNLIVRIDSGKSK